MVRHKTVPVHRHSYAYYLGGMTLFLFGMQVATGALLLLYYRPSASEAYESVQFIMTRVPFGWLVRYRRLLVDHERLPETSEAMILAAMTHLMLRRLEPVE